MGHTAVVHSVLALPVPQVAISTDDSTPGPFTSSRQEGYSGGGTPFVVETARRGLDRAKLAKIPGIDRTCYCAYSLKKIEYYDSLKSIKFKSTKSFENQAINAKGTFCL